MIISTSTDYRAAAQRKLSPLLFHYIDGGTYAEYTLRRNVEDPSAIAPCQRVLRNMSELSLEAYPFDETLTMPVASTPVGLTGMYVRRGEVQAARATAVKGVPFTLSTVSVCPIEKVASAIGRPTWFQLYVLKDHGFMRSTPGRAKAADVTTLVFTVDMPVPDVRYRDTYPGTSGPYAAPHHILRAMTHPIWVWDVGLLDKPHDLGNTSVCRGNPTRLEDYIGWLNTNFNPPISWKNLEWICKFWDGPMVIKGILDPEDAGDTVKFSVDGIVTSNHGGHQLDDTLSSIRALPAIADAVKGGPMILADSGIHTSLSVTRITALGTDSALLGRAFIYALAVVGGAGMRNLLGLAEKEMRVATVLTGAKSIDEISADSLVRGLGA